MTGFCSRVVFREPYSIDVCSEPVPVPGRGEVLVRTAASAISAGTELLFYRGQVPPDLPVDATIDGYQETLSYPLAYGYAAVGTVIDIGDQVPPTWQGRRVFAFQPHASHFVCCPDALQSVPDGVSSECAALFPSVETAVNLVMDAAPLLGERVVVMGQGVVGLLALSILREFPLASITVVDAFPRRRELARAWGATAALDPEEYEKCPGDADLILEVSGNPQALDAAVRTAGFASRIVIGSWYGRKPVQLMLGGHFHRNRVQIIGSQVSTIAPQYSTRWDRTRRAAVAWQTLARIPIDQLITHRFALHDAPEAFRLLDCEPEAALQVIFRV